MGERGRESERETEQATQVAVRNLCVFAADPYTLAQHFLNLSPVFSGHK